MTQLYAQPYDCSASGFYFDDFEEYQTRSRNNRKPSGELVEEYEIQFIDGDEIDVALAKAWELGQGNFAAFLEAAETWDEDQKIRFIIAVGECGHDHDEAASNPDQIDLIYYQFDSMKELAEHFVDEGLFCSEIPETLRIYLDYDAIARDLSVDYSEVEISGTNYIFYCF